MVSAVTLELQHEQEALAKERCVVVKESRRGDVGMGPPIAAKAYLNMGNPANAQHSVEMLRR